MTGTFIFRMRIARVPVITCCRSFRSVSSFWIDYGLTPLSLAVRSLSSTGGPSSPNTSRIMASPDDNNNKHKCRHIFCYGSLRPDDDSGMLWTKDAVAGLRAQPATVLGAKLYMDEYAALVFDDEQDEQGVDTVTSDDSQVVGWVLTTDSSTLFASKLKSFDRIEGYNDGDPDSSFYQRRIAEVCLGKPNQAHGGKAIGDEGSIVKAFVYHKPDCKMEHRIDSGDWLQRDK